MIEGEDLRLKIRRAAAEDLDALGKLGGELVFQHVAYDKLRFKPPATIVEDYTEFFKNEIANESSVVLIAELDAEIVGYAFIRFEAASFVELLAAGAWLHDIYLVEAARGKGVSEPFFAAIIEAAQNLGSASLMLSVSPHNSVARKFFERHGFRPTMQEMRLDFE